MRNIGIIANIKKDPGLSYTKELIHWLEETGCNVFAGKKTADIAGCGQPCKSMFELYEKADFIVVLGGDGTILQCARHTAKYDLPILGINFGTLGYLADVERADAKTAITAVLNGKYTLENRMLLEAVHIRDGKVLGEYLALNEVYVSHAMTLHIANLEMEINGSVINRFRADGIMVSTPTGSTAYNLSAGGPILEPDTRLMAVNCVCPHNLYSRPFVISGEDEVTIKILDEENMIFALDGVERISVKKDDELRITGSELSVKTIKTSNRSFYDTLRYKMMGN